jgi:hypothetical protein
MLIINTKSWHYRLYHYVRAYNDDDYPSWRQEDHHGDDPKSLCSYFWSWNFQLAKYIAWNALIFGFLAFLIALIPIGLWSWLVNHSHTARDIFLTLISCVAMLVAIGGIAVSITALQKKASRSLGLSGLGVVGEFIRAVKNRVCPLIEYKEE